MNRKLNREEEEGRGGQSLFAEICNSLQELIYPPSLECLVCDAPIDSERSYNLCDRCIRKLEWNVGKTCALCGKAMREGSPHNLCHDCMKYGRKFDRGISCTTYGSMERKLIQDFKFNGKSYVGRVLGEIMCDRLKDELLDTDVIIPVPIHPHRLRVRGYNQAEILAEVINQKMHIPLACKTLLRKDDTVARKYLDKDDRRATIQNAFYVRDDKKDIVEGCNVMLVDDIMTTGSTADACSVALKQAGASEVTLVTFSSGFDRPIGA